MHVCTCQGLDAYSSLMNASLLETQLENIINTTDVLWETIEDKQVFLQQSQVCSEFDAYDDELDFENKYPEVYQLIEMTKACDLPCSNNIDNYACRPYWYHNGTSYDTLCVYLCAI